MSPRSVRKGYRTACNATLERHGILPRRSVGEPQHTASSSCRTPACESTAPAPLDFIQSAPSVVNIFNVLSPSPRPLRIRRPWARNPALALAPNLIEAHINVGFHYKPWLDLTDSEPIALPVLERLYVSRPEALHIRAPVCTNWCFRSQVIRRTAISTLARASGYTFRCLCLRRCSYPNTTIALLIALPTITELRIVVTAEHLMEALTVNAVAAAPFARSWLAYS
ncbi:hypothetical protein MSAN_02077200 [Mycena sanguinolenta]|uniref:Uncharacterized protein n=1 Tax=Mycena sanguinolenta TaxID=230812 RepID=A0A8H6XGA5_9AGAR|nr:hypothetical protein MSAN_02077200 [Mycena sanguinolenta]